MQAGQSLLSKFIVKLSFLTGDILHYATSLGFILMHMLIQVQSSQKSVRVYRTKSYKRIKMYLKIQDISTRPNEFLPDMSGGQTEFREDCKLWQLARLL